MKRVLLVIPILALILALVLIPAGCMDIQNMIKNTIEEALAGLKATYTIEVGGTEGLNFTGRYVVVTAAYDPDTYVAFSSDSYDVSGNVSKQYTVTDAISLGAMFQKQSSGDEELRVKLWRGSPGTGTLVDSANTTDPFGAILVTAVKEG